jgi:hypothetical protein
MTARPSHLPVEWATAPLWAVTSYFNPQRFRRRLANYRLFRSRLSLPLATVELSFGADFELSADAADILLQLREGDVMWQKERLLNLALAALPPACRKVIWLDCDLLIGRQDWPERVARALDKVPIVQPFSRVYFLRRDTAANDLTNPTAAEIWQTSLPHARSEGSPLVDCLRARLERVHGTCAMGFAWAARREVLDRHGFYDGCIIGGGDAACTGAVYGRPEAIIRRHTMNDQQRDRYMAWAEPFFQTVWAEVLSVDEPIFHLWHGALSDRRPRERHLGLGPFHFDPFQDVAIAASGAWRWNSDKPCLHRYVRDYFAARNEDGARSPRGR